MPSTNIRVLPENVVNKIAAGEVVERPASVLKELMENALDAGGTRIDIEIAAGGRKLVAISDNGSGMDRDNALLAIERHATSKIGDVDDIEHINTLGFRGEALAAIASVSRFRLTSAREGDDAATEVMISGGKIQDVREIGGPSGTRIEVRDLFFNVPARRKFLRSQQTELTHIRSAFMFQALAHPEVGMSLSVDGRVLHRLAPGGEDAIADRVRDLFGEDYLAQLRPVDFEAEGVRVQGYTGLPSFSRADRTEQYVFVNGRATSAPLLGYAIRTGYHSLLPRDRHAVLVLFITVDPEAVDVNVHPTKKEVRFRRPSEVRDGVIGALQKALAIEAPAPMTFDGGAAPEGASIPHVAVPELQLAINDLPPARAFRYPRIPIQTAEGHPVAVMDQPFGPGGMVAPGEPAVDAAAAGAAAEGGTPAAPWSWCRVLGQVGALYVVLEIEDGMVLMDPHAAHERVLYEKFMQKFTDGGIATQSLLVPDTVELSATDANLVRRHSEVLQRMGVGIADFGGDSFVIDAVPAFLASVKPAQLLAEIVRELELGGASRARGKLNEDAIIQASCKAAVKSRDALTLDEIEQLVIDLAGTRMPYTCPHGRPTLIYTSYHELNRKFGREH
ncbi:MAG: DNA mismatch repair endonuclease MutL [Verrucomicrobia bacterium]|jgi:DNA mismatch repair protein MutL|nr:DNA mismatch repair endonuclease MutL [Verrucomicrobiota bacterium]MBT7066803.1 DNA mismatch repair endonuclease MutL [Verrucomicrobiota bacterium]MBT7701462.1 DNA mismatch repair endonuclease MutL [Verrucomicrobiota bacterium]